MRAHRLLSDLEFNGKTLACTINDKSQAFLDDYLDRALTDLALEAEDKAAAAAGEAVPDAKVRLLFESPRVCFLGLLFVVSCLVAVG